MQAGLAKVRSVLRRAQPSVQAVEDVKVGKGREASRALIWWRSVGAGGRVVGWGVVWSAILYGLVVVKSCGYAVAMWWAVVVVIVVF